MAVKNKKTSQKQWPQIYIGPVCKGFVCSNMQIFSNGYPHEVEALFSVMPELQNLFVLPSELREKLEQIQTKGTYLNLIYSKTKNLIYSGGLNVKL